MRNVTALRMERQHLTRKADETEYIALYRDLQPGQNVYWNGFGDPPSLTHRAAFDDVAFNRARQESHALIKGRFAGGNLGWIVPEDLELYAAAFAKPIDKFAPRQLALLELIEREGPLNIQLMKEMTGMLVKEITPALHRLQEAFLICEDQPDGEWDRGWYTFIEMFPDADLMKYTRHDALKLLLRRFSYRHVRFDVKMAKSFYMLPERDIKAAVTSLVDGNALVEVDGGYLLREDYDLLQTYTATPPSAVYAMHRNDFLVKSNAHWLKARFTHAYPETLYYLLIDGEFRGAAVGHFRNGPNDMEDIMLDLPRGEAAARKDEMLRAVHALCGANNPIKRYQGVEIL